MNLTFFNFPSLIFLLQSEPTFWFPEGASTTSSEVDSIFYWMFWVSVFFFTLIIGVMVLFAVKYRRRANVKQEKSPDVVYSLELVWSIIPLILLVGTFWWGWTGYKKFLDYPSGQDTLEIAVTARKWSWSFKYENGVISDHLYVPINTPVKLVMQSDDVIHSLWVPAFRNKVDVVPGRYAYMWFEATSEGVFPILCAEYCGTKHSEMTTTLTVQSKDEFEDWLRQKAEGLVAESSVEAGLRLSVQYGCVACHAVSPDEGAKVGPPIWGIYEKMRTLSDGTEVLCDEDYLRESMLEPNAKVVKGYEKINMNTYKGQLSDEQIYDIIKYIESLKDDEEEEVEE